MIRALLAAFVLLLPAAADRPGRPLVPVERSTISLNGPWSFAVGRSSTTVQVPHTWNVMPRYAGYEGAATYRRSFTLPTAARDAHVTLRFGAVFYEARVSVNGVSVGRHEGGYTPFELDLSRVARPGRNVVAVHVDNQRRSNRIPADLSPTWSFDWWNYGGIVRDVAVRLTSRAYVVHQRIVANPVLSAEDAASSATVAAHVRVRNTSTSTFAGVVRSETAGVRADTAVRLAPGAARTVRLELRLEAPKLWHFDHPDLYELMTTLERSDGRVLDRTMETFGIRAIELRGGRIVLNGEPVRLVGVTRHADSPAQGLAETVAVVAADYDDLKRLNQVLTRPVHYPQAEAVLEHADRNGLLLIPEVPAWQLRRAQLGDPRMQRLEQAQLRELVASQLNHPSVIAWSVANEIDSDSAEGYAFVRKAIAAVKAVDPTRPVGFASYRLYDSPGLDATRFSDFVLMNQYYGTWAGPKQELGAALDQVHAAFPEKPLIVSEFGFEPRWQRLAGVATHSLDRATHYFVGDAVDPRSNEADAQRRTLIAEQMAVFRSRPFVAGAIFWTYQDYRTPTEFTMGVVNANRKRRGSWRVLRDQYSPVVVEGVSFAGGTAEVRLRTRAYLPSYTLRGYTLRWPGGEIELPTLPPGSSWTGTIRAGAPLELAVVRPTGYPVLEGLYLSP
jgi:beta-galactosidase/beta-glucuronidase